MEKSETEIKFKEACAAYRVAYDAARAAASWAEADSAWSDERDMRAKLDAASDALEAHWKGER